MAWQLVLLNGGQPNESTQFPIQNGEFKRDPCTGATQPAVFVSGGVSDAVLAEIEAVQPYVRGDGAEGKYLGRINALNVIDKHRHLILNAVGIMGMHGYVTNEPIARLIVPGPLKDGEVVMVVTYAASEPEPNAQMSPSVDIVFGKGAPKPLIGERVLAQMAVMYLYAERVINRFRPLFREATVNENEILARLNRPHVWDEDAQPARIAIDDMRPLMYPAA